MYKLTHSHQWSALLVGLVIVILLTIMTVSFLEKVLNLGKTSGGINSSAQAYTLATWLIEEQLMDSTMTKQTPWNIVPKIEWSMSSTGRELIAATGWTIMPSVWKWNSTFDPDWNIISIGDPIQIVIPSGMVWSSVNFQFRVPTIAWATSSTGVAPSMNSSWIILWTFGYSGASLYASGESNIFRWLDITGTNKNLNSLNGLTQWQTNTGIAISFTDFYNSYWANCWTYQCTLKLSMLRPFLTQWWQSFSFLEYKIEFAWWNPPIPSQYMVIDSSAYILGYLRSRQIRIPQITTNTATDFAILQ